MYKSGIYLNKINGHLQVLAFSIRSKNQLFLNDDNKLSENFFRDLLNKIYGYQLINLNVEEKNCAGVDLGDTSNRLCIQVTASNTSKKIQDTLNLSRDHKRHEEYDRVVILIVGFKKKYTKNFISSFSSFNKGNDIWDINTLLEKISILSADQMQDIVKFLDSELETIIKIDPVDLLDEEILKIINLIFSYVCGSRKDDISYYFKKYKLAKREDDFILKKNGLNNVTDILFNDEIRPDLQYGKQISDFLGNPINTESQNKYFLITESIQKIYLEDPDQFNDIGSLFRFVFDSVINYNNRAEIDGYKLLIVLHNMYFNCDIGYNPS